uniref:Uncharacterized protein n=1 Tax=Odontella aurita TaxID=265563 RepID=A0A7S4N7J2_9STRA|mmetsp:Transcript_507/g.1529  ORF Transcript_507/g.1529 Transcript_507/m.1529 type:complete len:133 (+) Transcript_507:389-787(+)|eukprot:CAMPEP_0113549880 /NCGR_PEP_ID=MMETSP0015_2-20120614/13680_1 /TAXON_ID=2838 /ORGANISM="Odontella" /LENGTH=132 /DNA_ID=CAMNT_0000450641 /DNA_START=354 /DNA_END=752 /DNA_ORIENTATION=- /assembly_acc=CAM_ASM_000160
MREPKRGMKAARRVPDRLGLFLLFVAASTAGGAVSDGCVDPDLEQFMEDNRHIWIDEDEYFIVDAFEEEESRKNSSDHEMLDDLLSREADAAHSVNALIDEMHCHEDWMSRNQHKALKQHPLKSSLRTVTRR